MGLRLAFALLVAILTIGLLPVEPVAAHPLGNFSVNQYSRIEVGTSEARITYILDLAELPTVADRPLLDLDGDGTIGDVERESYLDGKLAEVSPALHLTAGATDLPLDLVSRTLALQPGQAGLETTRIEATFRADLSGLDRAGGTLTFRSDYASDRLGWREMVAINGADVRLEDAATLQADRSDALRLYPDDLLTSPLDERALTIRYTVSPGAQAFSGDAPSPQPGVLDFSERLGALVAGGTLSPASMALALIAAAGWGALHALSPGHGKTVVGAYLVGSRGTPRHALFLGLTVTITHTAGVIALGLVVLFASQTILPEQLYPWLSLISGLLVAALALTILRQRLHGLPAFGHHHPEAHQHPHDHSHEHEHDHDHDHGHEHAHAHDLTHTHDGHTHSHLPPGAAGEPITWRGLLALGISGGLLPCPSALLALLGAVAVGRAGFGLLVVLAFSLGLAATLSGVGLLFLYAGRYLERRTVSGPWSGVLRYAPAVAACAVTMSGMVIVARAVVALQGV